MDTIPPQLLQTVMALPESLRGDLAAELIASLEPTDATADPDYDAAWEAEIKRRLELHDSGRTQSISWQEARARIVGE